jgi:hypothetical protein
MVKAGFANKIAIEITSMIPFLSAKFIEVFNDYSENKIQIQKIKQPIL